MLCLLYLATATAPTARRATRDAPGHVLLGDPIAPCLPWAQPRGVAGPFGSCLFTLGTWQPALPCKTLMAFCALPSLWGWICQGAWVQSLPTLPGKAQGGCLIGCRSCACPISLQGFGTPGFFSWVEALGLQ